MSADLTAYLRQIERGLAGLGRTTTLALLRPGTPRARTRAVLAGCGLPPAPECEALYEWHDGTDADRAGTLDDIHLFPGFYLLSLADAVANYRAFAADTRWTPGWLPVFANGGGDFYVLDLTAAGQQPVRHFRIEQAEHPVEFTSLAALLATLVAAFQYDAFFLDGDGYLEMDDATFADLAARLNPGVPWWRG